MTSQALWAAPTFRALEIVQWSEALLGQPWQTSPTLSCQTRSQDEAHGSAIRELRSQEVGYAANDAQLAALLGNQGSGLHMVVT